MKLLVSLGFLAFAAATAPDASSNVDSNIILKHDDFCNNRFVSLEDPAEQATRSEQFNLETPSNGPLFKCSNFQECDTLENTSMFEHFMQLTAAQLAAFAYTAEIEEDAARYEKPKDKLRGKRYMEAKAHHYFDDTAKLNNYLQNDTIYELLDDNQKDWMTIHHPKGFYLHPGGNQARILGFSGILSIGEEPNRRNVAIVTFRGTQDGTDVKDDLDYAIKEDIYLGFYKRAKHFAIPMMKRLHAMLNDPKITLKFDDVLFTGHSLGGADAMIAPNMMKRRVYDEKFNATFSDIEKRDEVADMIMNKLKFHTIAVGAPKPGSKHFAQEFSENVNYNRRLTNDGDKVPTMPYDATAGIEALKGKCKRCKFTHVDENPIVLTDVLDEEDLGWFTRPSYYHGSTLYVARMRARIIKELCF